MSRTSAKVVLAVMAIGLAAGAAFAVTRLRAHGAVTAEPASVATGTAEVRRVDVATRRQIAGTLGFEGASTITAAGQGTLTALPPVGTSVRRGQMAYEVDGKPVTLFYGPRPSWRTLEAGMTDGVDVQQLEGNLKELGYGAGLTVDRHFTGGTTSAIRRWQKAAGLSVSGSVPLGQVVFAPGAIRVAGYDLTLGAQLGPGVTVEHGTSDKAAVTIQLSPRQLPTAKVGDPVVVTLPDGKTRTGRIVSIGAVTMPAPGTVGSNPAEPTAPVAVRVDGDTGGFLDQSQVQVAITIEAHRAVLTVPITALNALPDGHYEVIVVDDATTRRVPVRTGLFDEFTGLAEVSGPELAEGLKVRVPDDHA